MTTLGEALAEGMVHRLTPILQGQISHRMPRFLSPYLRMHDAIVAAGGGVTCHHIDLSNRSQVRHVAVWVPGRVVCQDCAVNNALSTPDDARETWVCDRCLQHRPGRVSASVMRLGATLVWFGICRDCHADMQTGGEL